MASLARVCLYYHAYIMYTAVFIAGNIRACNFVDLYTILGIIVIYICAVISQ